DLAARRGARRALVLLAAPALVVVLDVVDAVVDELVGIGRRGVAQAGQLDDVVVGDVPVDFGQPAVGLVGVVRAGGVLAERVGVVLRLDALGRTEEEQLVLDQR